jgi:hypothetical protein
MLTRSPKAGDASEAGPSVPCSHWYVMAPAWNEVARRTGVNTFTREQHAVVIAVCACRGRG